jgi:short-subunit dehydrogenase involved in D-alanine esterification of teichoic acids
MHAVIEPPVLLAVADHEGDGVLIVSADETIPFYNGTAAAMLHLPSPAQRLSLETLREFVRVIERTATHVVPSIWRSYARSACAYR